MVIVPKPAKASPIAAVVKTPVPEVSVKDWAPPETAPPKVRLREPTAPPEVLMVVAAFKVIGVLLSPMEVVPLLVTVPASVTELGSVAVKPAEKVLALELFNPICKLPVFIKVVSEEIVLVVPVIRRLYGFAVVTKDPVVSPPEKVIFDPLVEFDIVVALITLTAPEKLAPPELVIVRALIPALEEPIIALDEIVLKPEFNTNDPLDDVVELNADIAQDSSLLA